MDGVAAGPDADVWILRLVVGPGLTVLVVRIGLWRGWMEARRSGGSGARGRRVRADVRCSRCRWRSRCAALLAVASWRQPRGRYGGRRGQLRLVAGVHVAGHRAWARRSRPASSASRRCSTTSAACSTRAHASLRSPARSRCISPAGPSCPAASSTATRGSGRFARTVSSPRAACQLRRFLRLGRRRRPRLLVAVRLRAPVALRRRSSRSDARDERGTRRVPLVASILYVVFGVLRWRQSRLRLRQGADRRGGPAQRARRARGGAPIHPATPGTGARALCAEQR